MCAAICSPDWFSVWHNFIQDYLHQFFLDFETKNAFPMQIQLQIQSEKCEMCVHESVRVSIEWNRMVYIFIVDLLDVSHSLQHIIFWVYIDVNHFVFSEIQIIENDDGHCGGKMTIEWNQKKNIKMKNYFSFSISIEWHGIISRKNIFYFIFCLRVPLILK